MDCGPACLRMIAQYYGKRFSLAYLRERTFIDREGVSMRGIAAGAESIGFKTLSVKLNFEAFLQTRAQRTPQQADVLPLVALWKQKHLIVVYEWSATSVSVVDPARGRIKYSRKEFEEGWCGAANEGLLLMLEPTDVFRQQPDSAAGENGGWIMMKHYLREHRGAFARLALLLLAGSGLQMMLPFITQSLVDKAIQPRDYNFLYLLLAAQLTLALSQLTVGFLRSWVVLDTGFKINVALITAFLAKLMRLPISFFDTRRGGDIWQRIQDHYRIEGFLTGSTLSILFSGFNFLVFSIILAVYSFKIFAVFIVFAGIYVSWIAYFLRKRRELDQKRFQLSSENYNRISQIIHGIQDIKLYGADQQKRAEWEILRQKMFVLNRQSLRLEQWQEAGGTFFNEIKSVGISLLTALAVMNGAMTLGAMFAIMYIVGQLNAPLQSFVGFIRSAQDAQLSLERIGEIHQQPDESPEEADAIEKHKALAQSRFGLKLSKLGFAYNPLAAKVLKNIDLNIPAGKITAIVGSSGSGKTTLLKLLMKFYNPTEGTIELTDTSIEQNITHDFNDISADNWRKNIGVVMQEGYLFSDTIANNIALGDEEPSKERLLHAANTANILEFIDSQPLGFETRIGGDGMGVSQGQKQRLLIARAVYKNPQYLFFDEATNALDANNERVIMDNLNTFFEGRTVIVVAHRLSTVRHADQIIVLEKGEIIERGTHEELTELRGAYFNLIKNQLEMGK